MEFVYSILFAGHMLGLAAVVGAFFVQLRRKKDFILAPILTGAIVQLVTGIGMVGVAQMGEDGPELNMIKISVKLGIAALVLIAAIVAVVVKRKDGRVNPWFHAAGGLAVINVLVAVFWR